MNTDQARFNMIEQQIRTWDVLNTDVLNTLVAVRREEFVPAAYRSLAFFDTEVPLPAGQNMLSPKLEARMLQETGLNKNESVLEIGSGSGYMAALLGSHARHVTTVEIEPELHVLAQKNLAAYGVSNVRVELGDGAHGWSGMPSAYDVIVLSGSIPLLPQALLNQLNIGGRLIAIVGDAPIMSAKRITRVTDDAWETEVLFETSIKRLRNAESPSAFHF